MSKRVLMFAAAGVVAVLVAGGLFASNMGFKLTYSLLAANAPNNASLSGRNTLSLPYIPMAGITDSKSLCDDINSVGGAGTVNNLARLDPTINVLVPYDCVAVGGAFNLISQEAYEVAVNNSVDYPIVGSHDPTLVVKLTGPGGTLLPVQGGGTSLSGRNFWAYPYHSTALDAKQLCDEVNTQGGVGSVNNIARLDPAINLLDPYDCVTGTAFGLTPGEGYEITTNNNVTGWIPDHF